MGRALTTFGGGAGEGPGGTGPSGGRRVWSGSGGGGGGGRGGGRASGRRLVKAGAVKAEQLGGIKEEPGEDGKDGVGGVDAAAEELEELEFEEDPLSYDQYYPTMLPHRCRARLLLQSCCSSPGAAAVVVVLLLLLPPLLLLVVVVLLLVSSAAAAAAGQRGRPCPAAWRQPCLLASCAAALLLR